MGKRRRARELALQCLYLWDFHGPGDDEAEAAFRRENRGPEAAREFADQIVAGVKENQESIDELIVAQSRNWELHRMSRVDRNALRIAVFEFTRCPEIPPKVSIDEAIELGKKFGTTESGAFINGILDQIRLRVGKSINDPAEARRNDHDPDRDGDSV